MKKFKVFFKIPEIYIKIKKKEFYNKQFGCFNKIY
jgi:hypothetical protein